MESPSSIPEVGDGSGVGESSDSGLGDSEPDGSALEEVGVGDADEVAASVGDGLVDAAMGVAVGVELVGDGDCVEGSTVSEDEPTRASRLGDGEVSSVTEEDSDGIGGVEGDGVAEAEGSAVGSTESSVDGSAEGAIEGAPDGSGDGLAVDSSSVSSLSVSAGSRSLTASVATQGSSEAD